MMILSADYTCISLPTEKDKKDKRTTFWYSNKMYFSHVKYYLVVGKITIEKKRVSITGDN